MTYVLIVWLASFTGGILVPDEKVCQEAGQQLTQAYPGLQFSCVKLIGEVS